MPHRQLWRQRTLDSSTQATVTVTAPWQDIGVRVYQAFRFELDPGNRARSALSSHAGAARFACKWGLATVRAHRAAYEACRALALRQGASAVEAKAWAGEVVGLLACTLPARHRQWDRAKAEVAPWWAANSKEAYNSGLDALARALKGSFSPRSGRRRGHPVGPPPSKKRGPRQGSRVTTGAFGVVDGRHVRLPRIGVLRTNEPTSKMVARLAGGSARVPSATVSRQAGRWYVSFGCEVDRPASRLVVADRWYPSSKTCSACRAVKTKLALSSAHFAASTVGWP
jgi:putative transposase